MTHESTSFAPSVRGFLKSTDGVFSILTAILSVVIISFVGIAVDLGSIVYWQRRLQAATDTAAIAATFDLAQRVDRNELSCRERCFIGRHRDGRNRRLYR